MNSLFKILLLGIIAIILTFSITLAYSENQKWDCPECGRTGNTGNFCGGCGHPAPLAGIDSGDDAQVKVMTHAEYIAAAMDDEVVIESYVQDHQSWWDNKVSVYLQSEDGAYFAYNMTCSQEDAGKLVPGTKIRITGYKTSWAGEVEIADGATFEFVEAAPWIAEPTDVTSLLAIGEAAGHMNEFVTVKGAVIVPQEDGAAFNYKNPEEKTDDLYFTVNVGGRVYDFCVEYYLRGQDSDVYKAVENLHVGDLVDIEGFLYWYNEPNLQATGLTVRN